MTVEYPPQEQKPLEIEPRPNARYRVQSRSDPEVKHLVKWSAAEQSYSCSCPWGTHRGAEKDCRHIFEVKQRYAKTCNLGAEKGEWTTFFFAPWEHEGKHPVVFLCDRCNAFLSNMYMRGTSK